MESGSAAGVLITGVYGSGNSSVAAGISCLPELRREPHALLDLDYLGWGANDLEDVTVANDRPIALVAQEIMTWLGWQAGASDGRPAP